MNLAKLSVIVWVIPLVASASGVEEPCFGAIGNECQGGAPLVPEAEDHGSFYTQQVSVGSILHDNCCHRHKGGQMCLGYNLSQEALPDDYFCVKEWRKAVYNSRDKRVWVDSFPKDPAPNYLEPTPNRASKMADRSGNFVYTYSGGETVGTTKLAAPPGTALDISDEAFCKSGQFKLNADGSKANYGPLVGSWGICE